MKFFFSIALITACLVGSAQPNTTSFEELEALVLKEPKPILVFLHTSWCKYCHLMENTTLQNEKVISVINENYYFISFDAESKENLVFLDHEFRGASGTGNSNVHELAWAIGNIDGQISYPTIVFLDPQFEIDYQYGGALTTEQILQTFNILKSNE